MVAHLRLTPAAAYIPSMTMASNPEFEANIVREHTGRFGAKEHAAPDLTLPENPRAELDEVNALYHENTDRIREEVALYLLHGMPEGAHRVEFEESDEGSYLYVSAAFDENGEEIDTEDDFDRWADVDEIIELLGDPDDHHIGQFLDTDDNVQFTWTRTQPTNDADDQTIRERIDKLAEVRRELAAGSQAAAITAARRMVPEGARIIFDWSDQGDWLSVDEVVLADGAKVDYSNADDVGIDWDELDMVASDIRDANDPALSPVGQKLELAPKVGGGTNRPKVDVNKLTDQLLLYTKAAFRTEAGA